MIVVCLICCKCVCKQYSDPSVHIFRSITTSPGNTINNGICFSRSGNNDIRLLISNNDCTIRVYSVPSLRLLQTIEFNVAINHGKINSHCRAS